MEDFDGAVAIVTGAGGLLGRAYALELARRGARVVVNDVGQPGLDSAGAVAEEIQAVGGTAVPERSSVAEPEGGAAIVRCALESFERLDVVINNAGIARTNRFEDVVFDDLSASLGVSLLGTFHVTQPAWRHFRSVGKGVVVNTSSAVGLFGQRRSSVYAAAKMGVVGLTRVLALEGADYGIRANVVAPVAMTAMAGDVYGPLGPKLDPQLVAAAVAALASPSCTVSGEVLSVGGGRMARIVLGAAAGRFSPALSADEASSWLEGVVADEAPVAVPRCAMDEIDLIRACFSDLADYRMPPR